MEAYAQNHGGASGCVIRFGTLIKEWGPANARADIKSAAKGAIGATVLGLAVDAGLVRLDDRAQKYLPEIGTETPGNSPEWLREITLRHLATMTAGFDDGRPPKLVYRPGTRGIYSNDTANMLAELLTLQFDEDLLAVMKRKVLDPIGVDPADWRRRENRYRAKTLHGRVSREFASGITITHRALARIGYLYLRGGRWKGQTILSPEFIAASTRPTELPAPYPYYGFYWGSNAKGPSRRCPGTSSGRWDWATASWWSARASTWWPCGWARETPSPSSRREPTSGSRKSVASSPRSPAR